MPENLIVLSNEVQYTVQHTLSAEPKVTSVSTSKNAYRPGDRFEIQYGVAAGSVAQSYDLMIRVTPQATGNNYYFYDDKTDTSSRWFHSTAKPWSTGVPKDGLFSVPGYDLETTVIEDSVPSGKYDVLVYFSLSKLNKVAGQSGVATFEAVTSTPPGDCFVATAAFGSSLQPQVVSLRLFRDRTLLASELGRRFVAWYYRNGRASAGWIAPRPWARKLVRVFLWPLAGAARMKTALGATAGVALLSLLAGLTVLAWRRSPLAVRLALLAVALGLAASAGEIRGYAVRAYPFPVPVAGTSVKLDTSGSEAATGQDGYFRFTGVAAGQHKLSASAPGYLDGATEVSLSTASANLLVAVPMRPVSDRSYIYYFPDSKISDDFWTSFTFVNAGSTGADVTLSAYDSSGTFLGNSQKLTRLELGRRNGGSPADYFGSTIAQKASWYKLTSSAPVVATGILGYGKQSFGIWPFVSHGLVSTWLPMAGLRGSYLNYLTMVSVADRASVTTLGAFDGQGALLTTADNVGVLRPGVLKAGMLSDYFGDNFLLAMAAAKLTSELPVAGLHMVFPTTGKAFSAFPFGPQGSKRGHLVLKPSTGEWDVSLVLLNLSDKAATVTLQALDEEGRSTSAAATLLLGPGQQWLGAAGDAVSVPPQSKTVQFTADAAVFGARFASRESAEVMTTSQALSESGTRLCIPFIQSDDTWETTITVANPGSAAVQVTVRGKADDGTTASESTLTVPSLGARDISAKQAFGTARSRAKWAELVVKGGTASAQWVLTRLSSGHLSESPAMVAEATTSSTGVREALSPADSNLMTLWSHVRFQQVEDGFRLDWDDEVDSTLRKLSGNRLERGDVITRVGGYPVRTWPEAIAVAKKFRGAQSLEITVRKAATARWETIALRRGVMR